MPQKDQISSETAQVQQEIRQAAVRLVPYAVVVAFIGLVVWWVFRPSHLDPDKQLLGAASVAESLLLSAVFAGIAAMATVQFWKALFHPRSDFHAAELNRIFRGTEQQVLGLVGSENHGRVGFCADPREPVELRKCFVDLFQG